MEDDNFKKEGRREEVKGGAMGGMEGDNVHLKGEMEGDGTQERR
jgi:hypothetical protein